MTTEEGSTSLAQHLVLLEAQTDGNLQKQDYNHACNVDHVCTLLPVKYLFPVYGLGSIAYGDILYFKDPGGR